MRLGKDPFRKLFVILCLFLSFSLKAQAKNQSDDDSLVFEAEEYSTNIDTKITEVKGQVRIVFGGRELKANKVKIDGNNSTVYSEGEILYTYQGLKIEAESGEINFKSGLGNFKNAAIDIEDGVYLEGKEIIRLSEDEYRIKNGKFSTCRDCPQAWSLMGGQIDVQVEGYAEAHNAFFQIKNFPIVYFPFIYMPVKTKRQSGFLIPYLRFDGPLGTQIGIPFFWVLNDSTDATFEYSYMTLGGNKISNEFNYLYSDRSFFKSFLSYVDNNKIKDVPNNRFGLGLREKWQLTPSLTQRIQSEWTSDEFFAQQFDREFRQTRLPALSSEVSLEKKSKNYQLGVGATLYQNNIFRENSNPLLAQEIHKLPFAQFDYPDLLLWEPFTLDLNIETLSLRRYEDELFSSPVDLDPNTTWIRTGDRISPQLQLKMPVEFLNRFLWQPSATFRYDFYHFNGDINDEENSAHRFRTVFEQKLSTNIWSVFDFNLRNLKKIKHVWSPFVRWSYAPEENRSEHPFFDQCEDFFGFCIRSPKFDLFDPNADSRSFSLRSFDFEQRLKPHHLLSYGFSSRLIGRWNDEKKEYKEILFLNVEQDYDLKEEETGNLRMNIQASIGDLKLNGDLYYNFRENELNVLNEARYRYRIVEVNTFQFINDETKNYGGGVTLSDIGPFSLGAELVYDDFDKQLKEQTYNIGYISSSKCWRFNFALHRIPGEDKFQKIPTFQISYSQAAAQKPSL